MMHCSKCGQKLDDEKNSHRVASIAGGIMGDLKEFALRTPLVHFLDKNEPLIGPNPYRYAGMDLDGAAELSKLIKETDKIVKGFNAKEPIPKRIFAAHSESDETAGIRGIERLEKVSEPETFVFYRIPKRERVSHASLVLKDDIYATGASESDKPLEDKNPLFDEMMAAVKDFQN